MIFILMNVYNNVYKTIYLKKKLVYNLNYIYLIHTCNEMPPTLKLLSMLAHCLHCEFL